MKHDRVFSGQRPGWTVRAVATACVPLPVRRWLRAQQRRHRLQWARVGTVDFGDLRRTSPVSAVFGLDRGLAIDRYYMERFLSAWKSDIRGRVLEFGDARYTRQFGGAHVARSDVHHSVAGNPQATIVADLTRADGIAADLFDCIICTQTLQLIYDVREAIVSLHRMLKSGGVVLATAPGISQISNDQWRDTWYWSFTPLAANRLLGESFGAPNVEVEGVGNVLSATAFLQGLASDELSVEELDARDPAYPLVVTMKAVKVRVSGVNIAVPR